MYYASYITIRQMARIAYSTAGLYWHSDNDKFTSYNTTLPVVEWEWEWKDLTGNQEPAWSQFSLLQEPN